MMNPTSQKKPRALALLQIRWTIGQSSLNLQRLLYAQSGTYFKLFRIGWTLFCEQRKADVLFEEMHSQWLHSCPLNYPCKQSEYHEHLDFSSLLNCLATLIIPPHSDSSTNQELLFSLLNESPEQYKLTC